jgi:uracil-DNA glycosylase family 4
VKARSLDDAKREVSECTRCTSVSNVTLIPLVKGRTQVVYGIGPPTAELMFIGEAPGKDEDEKGEPFVGNDVGQAGRVLNERLDQIGVPRGKVYITNVVKCRPTKVVEGRPPSNRPPSTDEIEACADWLDEQVRLVNPKLIVPLGVRATSRVLGRKVLMREVHGELVPGQESVWRDRTITIIPTYHPTGIRGNTQRMQAFSRDLETIRDVYRRLRE